MKKIDFPNGKFAIFDDEFEELVSQYNWRLCTKTFKPIAYINKKQIILSNFILNHNSRNTVVIHKNKNVLDCQLSNLVEVSLTKAISRNGLSKINKTGYKGVKQSYKDRFRADIRVNGNPLYLGTYEFANDAAEAYNKKSKELYGELAYQNKIK